MKKFEKTKGFIIGIAVCWLIGTMFTSVFAQSKKTKQLTAYYNNIEIMLDGRQIVLKDAAGNAIEPFIVDGTTYLPVRAVAEALGLQVAWFDAPPTVVLNSDNNQPEPTEEIVPKSPVYLETKKRPAILMYHSISDEPYQVTEKNFEEQMKYLSENGYTFLFPEEIHDSDEYDKPIIITFDDGCRDNYQAAFPILKKYNAKATVFMITYNIGKDDFLTEKQIKELETSGLVRVEPHTHNHTDLSQLTIAGVRSQIEISNAALKKITGRDHKIFAYPYGNFNDDVKNIASEYYDMAFATGRGSQKDIMALYRTSILGDTDGTNDMDEFKKYISITYLDE